VSFLARARRSLAFRARRRWTKPTPSWEERWRTGSTAADGWYFDEVEPVTLELLDGQTFVAGAAVDVGCGAGTTLAELDRRFPVAVGMDLAPSAVRQAGAAVPHASVLVGRVPNLPFASASAAFLHDRGCYHLHGYSRRRYLDEIARVLRPGGLAQLVENRAVFAELDELLPSNLIVEQRQELDDPNHERPVPMGAVLLRRI
jgi:SAM-dependent methyltransferase